MNTLRARACALVFFLSGSFFVAEAQIPGTNRPKVALVLEGGGALGLAHIGVIKIIEQLGIPVDIVVGTSMGAIVGGFYSLGYTADQLERVALDADWLDLFTEDNKSVDDRFRDRIDRSRFFLNVDFDKKGFKSPEGVLSGKKILTMMDRLTIAESDTTNFDTLPRRFRAVATDISTGEEVVLDRGSLSDAMRASMSIPGVFAPYFLNGRRLVDGGIVDNLAINLARSLGADLVLAVHLAGGTAFGGNTSELNPFGILAKSLDILIKNNVYRQFPSADYVLTVDLRNYHITDFNKAGEILAQGEQAALDQVADLKAFREKSGTSSPLERIGSNWIPGLVDRIQVVGVDPKTRAYVEKLFAPTIGLPPNDVVMKQATEELYRTGRYDSIRLALRPEPESNKTVLRVSLVKKLPEGNSLRLGFFYASTYSGSMVSSQYVTPGIVLRGLTTEDSRLAVDTEILDTLEVKASFFQPIERIFFAEAHFSSRQDTKALTSEIAITYLNQTRSASIGGEVGMSPTAWSEFSAGINYDWIGTEIVPDLWVQTNLSAFPVGHVKMAISAFDSPVLPTQGVGLDVTYTASLPGLGASTSFQTLETQGRVVPPVEAPFTLKIAWKAATDFSQGGDDPNSAPPYYKPDLADRNLFPGPMKVLEHLGSHVGGAGLTAKWQINWATRAAGFPAFLVAQVAAGFSLQDLSDSLTIDKYTYWNSTIGFALRINDGFGILARTGIARGFDKDFKPFVSLDIGNLGY